jgi:type II secretory pathway component PulM
MNLTRGFVGLPWPPAVVRFWDGASPRERTLVLVACAVMLLAAAWTALWQPLVADTARLERARMRDSVVLAAARADAEDVAGLQRSAAPARSGEPRTAVERVVAERGLRPMLASLDVQDGRVRATFTAIRFDALVGALDALAKNDGVFPVEMTLTPRVEPGTLRAELVLAR